MRELIGNAPAWTMRSGTCVGWNINAPQGSGFINFRCFMKGWRRIPFASESVEKWRSEHVRWVKEKPAVDWRVVGRADAVIQEMKAARAPQLVTVAVA